MGHAAQTMLIQQITFPTIIWLTFLCAFGWNIARLLLLPLSLIYLVIPIWEWLIPYLQAWAVTVTESSLNYANIPAFIEGNLITIPDGQIEVSKGCSGLNYLLVGTILSILIGHLNQFPVKHKILFTLFSIGLSIISNWIRIIALVFIAHATEMQSTLVKDHVSFGWGIFMFALIPMILVSYYYNPAQANKEEKKSIPNYPSPKISKMIMIGLIAVSAPLLSFIIDINNNYSLNQVKLKTPKIDAVQSKKTVLWRPDYHNETHGFSSRYETEQLEFDLTIKLYAKQSESSELIKFNNRIPSNNDIVKSIKSVSINNTKIKMVHLSIQDSDEDTIVLYWFDVAGRTTSNKYMAKLYQTIAYLNGKLDASLVTLSANCSRETCQVLADNLLLIAKKEFDIIEETLSSTRLLYQK